MRIAIALVLAVLASCGRSSAPASSGTSPGPTAEHRDERPVRVVAEPTAGTTHSVPDSPSEASPVPRGGPTADPPPVEPPVID